MCDGPKWMISLNFEVWIWSLNEFKWSQLFEWDKNYKRNLICRIYKHECYPKKKYNWLLNILNTDLSFTVKVCWRYNMPKHKGHILHYIILHYITSLSLLEYENKIPLQKLMKNSTAASLSRKDCNSGYTLLWAASLGQFGFQSIVLIFWAQLFTLSRINSSCCLSGADFPAGGWGGELFISCWLR